MVYTVTGMGAVRVTLLWSTVMNSINSYYLAFDTSRYTLLL
jgi:hypothetical protein